MTRRISPPQNCPCPKSTNLQCGVDGTTRRNSCERECAGVALACEGPCPCPDFPEDAAQISFPDEENEETAECHCSKTLNPQCGADGQTYANNCLRECAGVESACAGTCPCLTRKRDECNCPETSKPQCGVDGKTYTNDCLRQCAGVILAGVGRCPGDFMIPGSFYCRFICLLSPLTAFPFFQLEVWERFIVVQTLSIQCKLSCGRV